MTQLPTLLLVHGSWHGPWCWDRLVPELTARGLRAETVALPSCGTDPARLGSLADDARAVEAAAAAIAGDVVLVGHSYGGVVITEARHPAGVRHLVYLGAFMPDIGQSLFDLLPPGPLPPFVVANADGSTSVDPALAVETFYADCDAETAAWAAGQLRLHNGACNATPVSRAAWRELPSTYIALGEDRASPPPMQEALARQAGETRRMATSHSPFLSRPAELAELLGEIAAAVAARRTVAA